MYAVEMETKEAMLDQPKQRKPEKLNIPGNLKTTVQLEMTATEYHSDGRVEVKYCSQHTNHQLGVGECRNLPLPNSVKQDIQQQFVAGITI